LKVTDENIRIRIRIRWSETRIRGSGSVPKCHGSATRGQSGGYLRLSHLVPVLIPEVDIAVGGGDHDEGLEDAALGGGGDVVLLGPQLDQVQQAGAARHRLALLLLHPIGS
jgi:hypothetical protein